MHDVALDLLILLAGIWLVAVTLRPLGLPTIMGELIVGVLVGPAVFGLIEPSEAITLLAEIGIFFLMFHAGVETQPLEFFDALKRSFGVALVGAIVPFGVSFGVATAFGLDTVGAVFVGLTMTATAVVITLKTLRDLGLADTRVARVIVASCVIDDLLTLVFFGLVVGVLSGGSFEPLDIAVTLGKVVAEDRWGCPRSWASSSSGCWWDQLSSASSSPVRRSRSWRTSGSFSSCSTPGWRPSPPNSSMP